MSQSKKGYLYLFPTFFIWGSLFVVSKYTMEIVPPMTVLLIRYVLAIMVLGVIFKKQGGNKFKKEHFKYFFLIGGLGYFVSIAFQLMGTKLLDASLSSLINAMNPVAMLMLAVVILKEKMTVSKVASIALSLVGVYIILGVNGSGISIPGIIFTVMGVLLWSLASIIIRKIADDYTSIQTAFYSMIVALIFNVPAAAWELRTNSCSFDIPAILSLLYLGIVCTAVAHTFWNKSLQLLDAGTCSLFYPLQPLVSAVMGVVFLHEKITMNFVWGSVIICAGILIAVLADSKKNES